LPILPSIDKVDKKQEDVFSPSVKAGSRLELQYLRDVQAKIYSFSNFEQMGPNGTRFTPAI
jgi:hypothetical protein